MSVDNLSFSGYYSNGSKDRSVTSAVSIKDIKGKVGSAEYTGSILISGFDNPKTEIVLKGADKQILGQVAAELYLSMIGQKAMYVPYKGVPPSLNALMAGEVQFIFADSTFGIAQSRSGKIKALAVTNPQRTAFAPEIPTMAESGAPGYDLVGWYALFMPPNTPKEVAQRLATLSNATVTSTKAREFLSNLASEAFPGSPESLGKFLVAEIARWGRLIKAAGIQPE